MDQDYIKKLNNEEKAFLSKFNTEYYGADLDFKNLENNLHNTPELKKDCTDRNNKQNNDVYGVARATGTLITDYHPVDQEDELEEEPDDLL